MGCQNDALLSIAASMQFHRGHSATEPDAWALQKCPNTANTLRQFAEPFRCQRSRQRADPVAIGTDTMDNSAAVVERPHLVNKISIFRGILLAKTWGETG